MEEIERTILEAEQLIQRAQEHIDSIKRVSYMSEVEEVKLADVELDQFTPLPEPNPDEAVEVTPKAFNHYDYIQSLIKSGEFVYMGVDCGTKEVYGRIRGFDNSFTLIEVYNRDTKKSVGFEMRSSNTISVIRLDYTCVKRNEFERLFEG